MARWRNSLLVALCSITMSDCCARTVAGGGALREPAALEHAAPIWDFASELTQAQRAVNARIHDSLPADECDGENAFDPRAHELAMLGTPESLVELRKMEHAGGRERQAAAGRAYVFLASRSLAAGQREHAAEHSLHAYLSSVPHRLRMEALRIYCRSGRPDRSLHWIRLIESGEQDARFTPMLAELRAARQAKIAED